MPEDFAVEWTRMALAAICRRLALPVLAMSVLYVPCGCAVAKTVRLASWNMNNLHFKFGLPLRPGAPQRSAGDYETLNKYRDAIAADVYALQEVNGPRAARMVFPEDQFELYFSGHYVQDLASGHEGDGIYTGFAVRRGRFDAITKQDYAPLGILHSEGHSLRWGTELLVEIGDARLRVLNVHLKSGCAQGSLTQSRDASCITLARQIKPLEEWIDARAKEPFPFVLLGDFNRAFDRYGADDHLWRDIDDGEPAGLALKRLPSGQRQTCWRGTRLQHDHPIDFFVFDQRAWSRVAAATFRSYDYAVEDRNVNRKTPSDHCPIAVDIAF